MPAGDSFARSKTVRWVPDSSASRMIRDDTDICIVTDDTDRSKCKDAQLCVPATAPLQYDTAETPGVAHLALFQDPRLLSKLGSRK